MVRYYNKAKKEQAFRLPEFDSDIGFCVRPLD